MEVVRFASDLQSAKPTRTPTATTTTMRFETEKTFFWIIKVGLALCIGLGFWYILLVNSVATRGFTLEAEKNQRTTITKELQKWDIALTIPASLYALESSEQIQEMSEITNLNFVKLSNGQLAMR